MKWLWYGVIDGMMACTRSPLFTLGGGLKKFYEPIEDEL